ncbi:MAG: efflux RND transporter periplasmic adaptor subunit [Kangiellaceae bacterium]|nr:efflux RND transporter periplasmic adaptor subunit [Kangiellaceae bacterium]
MSIFANCSVKRIVTFIIVCLISSCGDVGNKKKIQKPLRPVKTIKIEHPRLGKIMEYSAVIDASQKADLSFKLSGEIIQLLVNQGDEVKKGQVLATLNDKDFRLVLDEAQTAYETAKADYDRGTNLIKKNVISNADYDKLRTKFSSANTKLESAKNNMIYTKLVASFDGIIARKYTENFQEISAKEPVLALHNIKQVNLKIDVPESVMIQIPRNDESRVVVAIFDEIPGQEFPVKFKEIATQADEITKTYEATFVMQSPPDHTILPGMTAVLKGTKRLTTSDSIERYYLPSNAVLKDSTGNFVYLVESVGEGKGKIIKVLVSVGEITAQGIEVYSGVTAGQDLVVAGVSKVTDGMLVRFNQ